MQQDHSQAVAFAFDHTDTPQEDFTAPSGETGPAPEPEFTEEALSALFPRDIDLPSRPAPDVGDIMSRFNAAAEAQSRAHQDLSTRIDRLENNVAAGELRQAVRELHDGLSGLASETVRNVTRIDERLSAMTQMVNALRETVAASNHAFRHLSISAHDKIAALEETLNVSLARVALLEKSAAEAAQTESPAAAPLEAQSQRLDALEQKLAGFTDSGPRVAAITKRMSDLGTQTSFAMGILSEKFEVLQAMVSTAQPPTEQLARIEQALETLRGQDEKIAADIAGLNAGLQSLDGTVNQAGAQFAPLKERLEKAETEIAAATAQAQTLITLHTRLTDAFAGK